MAAGPGQPDRRRPLRSLAFMPACLILLASAVSGCASTVPGSGHPPCFPPAFSVEPLSAKPGDRVAVMAPDAVCDPRYGANARIQVTMTDATGVEVLTATAPMNDAGGFSYGFELPAGIAAGEAAITAMPFNIDVCSSDLSK